MLAIITSIRRWPRCGGIRHFRLAAGYVDRILRGANPGHLPIFAISRHDFVINLRTAHALGLALPPDFVSAANEVIEWTAGQKERMSLESCAKETDTQSIYRAGTASITAANRMHPDTQERLFAAIFIACALVLLIGLGFVIIHYLGHGDLGSTVGVLWAFTWVLGYSWARKWLRLRPMIWDDPD
jgi:hypothetical protein